MYHLNDLNFQMSKKAPARPLQRSLSESSSEESDADDDSSVHASQWKCRLAKPTEADSSYDGRRRSKSSRKSSRSDSGKKGVKSEKGKGLSDSIVESTGASASASAGAGVKASLSFRNCFFEFLSPGHEN